MIFWGIIFEWQQGVATACRCLVRPLGIVAACSREVARELKDVDHRVACRVPACLITPAGIALVWCVVICTRIGLGELSTSLVGAVE